MPSPADRRYNPTHEWQKLDAGVVTLGVSQFAVDELTDVTFVEVTVPPGGKITAGQPFGEIESVKTVADLVSPLTGKVLEVNKDVISDLDTLKEEPFEDGWIIRVKPSDPAEIENLMTKKEYEEFLQADKEEEKESEDVDEDDFV